MIRFGLPLILSLIGAVTISAQRHGRADALQNYLRSGLQSPQLPLQVRVADKRLYFRQSDFSKMHRSQIAVADPATGMNHTYAGVNLEELVPGASLASDGNRGLQQPQQAAHGRSAHTGKRTRPVIWQPNSRVVRRS